jgi:ribA/ribD-fused uncharacterized protein
MSIACTPSSLERIHRAASLIETVGKTQFNEIAAIVGPTTALAMIVAHERMAWKYASNPNTPIVPGVNALLGDDVPMGWYLRDTGFFYTPQLYFLDNCSAFQIRHRDQRWPTVEHAYQAAKFKEQSIAWCAIKGAPSPHEAQRLAHHEYANFSDPEWDTRKLEVMRTLLWRKVKQHEYVKRKLLATAHMRLVEDSPTDNFWGRGPTWEGENWLGRLWMEIREQLRNA